MKVPFNIPTLVGREEEYLGLAIKGGKLSGDGEYTKKCHTWFEENFKCYKALLTTSCTHALEMAAILADVRPGDEVIMPSYTFVSTANAFVLRGAKIVFVDIRPDTMNINENNIERAVTEKTKVIVPVHYSGVASEMDSIMNIADKYGLIVVEDAAQAVMSTYKGKALGTIGHLGCYSFHDTKNYTCGEGGALLINREEFIGRAEVIREKGTNRSRFLRGQVDKYTWIDIGSSYLPSELNAACLYAQLEEAEKINENRLDIWNRYYEGLQPLAKEGVLELPHIPSVCQHNGSIFYLKVWEEKERELLIEHLKNKEISSAFHYIPLHSSQAGQNFGEFLDEDLYTTKESSRLLRLPLYYGLEKEKINYILEAIKGFYRNL